MFNRKIQTLVALGEKLKTYALLLQNEVAFTDVQEEHDRFRSVSEQARLANGWFTAREQAHAMMVWADNLNENALLNWLSGYEASKTYVANVGLILAGNIPLVGFHDLICGYLSPHRIFIKTASDDAVLPSYFIQLLTDLDPDAKGRLTITHDLKGGMDAYIATGSNNSSRYFRYYFRDKPYVIRKNRQSVAVLQARETRSDLSDLALDIFAYFGLGCRSVSKLLVPENYVFDDFFEAIFPFHEIVHHKKYGNNYEYNRAVYLMNGEKILDNNFMLLKEDSSYASPVGVLFYERYADHQDLLHKLEGRRNDLQCIVSGRPLEGFQTVAFGHSQNPSLHDYADGIDIMSFLLHLR